MVRRAGKSPPGGASRAAPRRASSGPSSSTEPRSFPTSTGSGRSVVTVSHWMRNVGVPAPSTVAPSPRSSSSSTSTSRMRGTLAIVHSSSVSRQAAISGSAEFLFPSTVTAPDSRRPPSIRNVAISPPSLPTSPRAWPCPRRARTPCSQSLPAAARRTSDTRRHVHRSISRRTSPAEAPPSLTMKLPWVGDTRASPSRAPLSPARSTSAPADHGMPGGSESWSGAGF